MSPKPKVTELRLKRRIPAPPEHVFRACTKAEELQKWMCPDSNCNLTVESDPRVGGKYRVEMATPDNDMKHVAAGEFIEMNSPNHIAMSWKWIEGGTDDARDSRLEFHLREVDGATELELIHLNFASEKARDEHSEGWSATLDRLQGLYE